MIRCSAGFPCYAVVGVKYSTCITKAWSWCLLENDQHQQRIIESIFASMLGLTNEKEEFLTI